MTITGLRQRLENLDGVAAIQLELAESGLSGIRVTLAEGADETMVLERIRSMLVTYGLRSPDPITNARPDPARSGEIETSITPDGEELRVEVRARGERVVQVVEATPLAAAQAVAAGRAKLTGHPEPEVIWIGLDVIGKWKILTILAEVEDDRVGVGSAVVDSGWANALDRAVSRAIE